MPSYRSIIDDDDDLMIPYVMMVQVWVLQASWSITKDKCFLWDGIKESDMPRVPDAD